MDSIDCNIKVSVCSFPKYNYILVLCTDFSNKQTNKKKASMYLSQGSDFQRAGPP